MDKRMEREGEVKPSWMANPATGAFSRAGARSSGVEGPGRGWRVALYSHDTMGLGHTRRNLAIARALVESTLQPTVLLITGVRQTGAFDIPPRTECLTLPALYKEAHGGYRARCLDLPLRELVRLRAGTIRAAIEGFQPQALIVDKTPRGAAFELDPTLELLRARGGTRCVLGLREVLDDPENVRNEWNRARNASAVRNYYDSIWIYGDPAVYDPIQEYGIPSDLACRIHYTGYLGPRRRLAEGVDASRSMLAALALPAGRLVLCLVGGGQDGSHLAEAFVEAELPPNTNGVIVTGPFMPREKQDRLRQRAAQNPRLRVLDFIKEPDLLLPHADRVIAMGGYNTVCGLLSLGRPTLIVPRVSPRREQQIRAERLEKLRLVNVLDPARLDSKVLTEWLARENEPIPPVTNLVDLDGLDRVPRLLARLLSAPSPAGQGPIRAVEASDVPR